VKPVVKSLQVNSKPDAFPGQSSLKQEIFFWHCMQNIFCQGTENCRVGSIIIYYAATLYCSVWWTVWRQKYSVYFVCMLKYNMREVQNIQENFKMRGTRQI